MTRLVAQISCIVHAFCSDTVWGEALLWQELNAWCAFCEEIIKAWDEQSAYTSAKQLLQPLCCSHVMWIHGDPRCSVVSFMFNMHITSSKDEGWGSRLIPYCYCSMIWLAAVFMSQAILGPAWCHVLQLIAMQGMNVYVHMPIAAPQKLPTIKTQYFRMALLCVMLVSG